MLIHPEDSPRDQEDDLFSRLDPAGFVDWWLDIAREAEDEDQNGDPIRATLIPLLEACQAHNLHCLAMQTIVVFTLTADFDHGQLVEPLAMLFSTPAARALVEAYHDDHEDEDDENRPETTSEP